MTVTEFRPVTDQVQGNGNATHAVAVSTNGKLAPHRPSGKAVAATYRTYASCPSTCAFLGNGCFAAGRIENVAHRYGDTGDGWALKVAAGAPFEALMRHFVVGDLLGDDDMPDVDYLQAAEWLAGKRPDIRAFGYTHTWRRPDVFPGIVPGAVINASCETPEDIVAARAEGWDTVVTVPDEDAIVDVALEAGTPVVLCPAQRRDDVGCGDCGLCAKSGRAVTVAFITHGGGAKRASAAIARRNA